MRLSANRIGPSWRCCSHRACPAHCLWQTVQARRQLSLEISLPGRDDGRAGSGGGCWLWRRQWRRGDEEEQGRGGGQALAERRRSPASTITLPHATITRRTRTRAAHDSKLRLPVQSSAYLLLTWQGGAGGPRQAGIAVRHHGQAERQTRAERPGAEQRRAVDAVWPGRVICHGPFRSRLQCRAAAQNSSDMRASPLCSSPRRLLHHTLPPLGCGCGCGWAEGRSRDRARARPAPAPGPQPHPSVPHNVNPRILGAEPPCTTTRHAYCCTRADLQPLAVALLTGA